MAAAELSPQSEPCDPDGAAVAVEAAWARWRTGDVNAADSLFRRGARLCRRTRGAWTGLGYVALRQSDVALAIARFDSAFAVDTARDVDNAIGLGLATYRAGQLARARAAFLLADSLAPGDSTVRSYLARLPAPVDASQLPAYRRPRDRVIAARVGRRVFEVPNGRGGYQPFWVKAVNLGAALPGKHPSEFPPDDGTYEGWISTIAEMGANTIRLYTIHPPHFYRALRAWNLAHPTKRLWLIHGVWTELPPGPEESEYDDPEWHGEFLAEMNRVVDLLHGQAAIQPRAGHASGLYASDVSAWTLGYILGREWEPYSVIDFVSKHPESRGFSGRYVRVEGGNAVDVWIASVADSLIAYEMGRFNAERPVAYTNWPTLDPLHHPTETTRAEESAWLARRGERVPEASREYDNDAISLDATVMHATPEYSAGLFASYHAYPYYPDFLVLDSTYRSTVGPEGPSAYLGYLRELVAHHGDIPVVISEYGVPSSRGNAHLQPQGWHHGGHDEEAQARINARLTREIIASGAAGVGLFALIDEWFKKNWLVIDFEQPLERNRLWLNVLDAEQNYGVIAMRAGPRDSAMVIDGARNDWRGRPPYATGTATPRAREASARLHAFWVHADEAYVYLRLDVGRIDWRRTRYVVGIDTYDAELGDRQLPFGGASSPVGLEFVLDLNSPDDARLLVDGPYNLYRFEPIRGSNPPATMSVYNRPFRSRANDDGLFDTLWVTPNRRTIGRDGTVFPAQRIDRNKLRFARQSETTLADWFADSSTHTIEVRLPWGLLHVTDPSSRTVLFGVNGGDPATRVTNGFRFVVQSLPRDGSPGERLPTADGESFSPPRTWAWPTWEEPRWYAERKPLFGAMQELFRSIPDAGPRIQTPR